MGIFDRFRTPDINSGVEKFRNTAGAVLIDVRDPDEYRLGHIPGSRNIPLSDIGSVESLIDDLDAPIFVHCLSGVRSSKAVARLEEFGYTNVKNIGGIGNYTGELEK